MLAQISDLHCGSAGFDDELLGTVVAEILALAPDLVVVGGDLTADGYAHQFRIAQGHLEPLIEAGLTMVVVPGNHDARNVGHLHFTDAFGSGDVVGRADRALLLNGGADHSVQVVAIDSSQPDVPDGAGGRGALRVDPRPSGPSPTPGGARPAPPPAPGPRHRP